MVKLRVGAPPEEFDSEDDIELSVPVLLPDLTAIRDFAFALHKQRHPYAGEWKGWPVSYDPGSNQPPIDSRLTFTPAVFFIGVWPLWYVSFTWEYGADQEPYVLVGDEYIVQTASAVESNGVLFESHH
ncbi:MAG: hypothetical protein M3Q45_08365 [Chloroflexota bacterium]|nr:hypothetical protein [Chloroflexota bacterium]